MKKNKISDKKIIIVIESYKESQTQCKPIHYRRENMIELLIMIFSSLRTVDVQMCVSNR